MHLKSLALLAPLLLAPTVDARFAMYYDQWHPDRPTNAEDRAGVDHLIIAFAQSNTTETFTPSIPISTARQEYPNAKIMIAIGGWGDIAGFSSAVASDSTINTFAQNIANLLQTHGADGIDIDWEYPGGNGADYKKIPNSAKTGEIPAFPELLFSIRSAIGKDKLLSIAVPGKKGDMLAFTPETGPKIWPSVDFVNVMSYDIMNRRDNTTAHHTSVLGSLTAIQNYLDIGAPAVKLNLGFAYYAKYFTTAGDCGTEPLNCPVAILEDPTTGADTGLSGAYTFEKAHLEPIDGSKITVGWGMCGPATMSKCALGCCSSFGYCGTSPEYCGSGCQHAFGSGCTGADVAGSWQRAAKNGITDEKEGAMYYYDTQEKLFWSWDTPELMARKFRDIVQAKGLGGVMAWSLGEDSADWRHVRAMARGMAGLGGCLTTEPEKPEHMESVSPGYSNPDKPTQPNILDYSTLDDEPTDNEGDCSEEPTPYEATPDSTSTLGSTSIPAPEDTDAGYWYDESLALWITTDRSIVGQWESQGATVLEDSKGRFRATKSPEVAMSFKAKVEDTAAPAGGETVNTRDYAGVSEVVNFRDAGENVRRTGRC